MSLVSTLTFLHRSLKLFSLINSGKVTRPFAGKEIPRSRKRETWGTLQESRS
jgi:hypothetical protein